MKKDKIKQITIYRRGLETPIILHDKSSLEIEEYKTLLTNVFASPKISVIETSSSLLILKPSQVDAIEINTIKHKIPSLKKNEINEETKSKFIDITKEFSEPENIVEEVVVDKIDIDNISLNNSDETEVVSDGDGNDE